MHFRGFIFQYVIIQPIHSFHYNKKIGFWSGSKIHDRKLGDDSTFFTFNLLKVKEKATPSVCQHSQLDITPHIIPGSVGKSSVAVQTGPALPPPCGPWEPFPPPSFPSLWASSRTATRLRPATEASDSSSNNSRALNIWKIKIMMVSSDL